MKNKTDVAPKYLDAKKRIKLQIEEGSFEGKIPGERILAEQIGYSYLTIRQAINELVDEGVLYRQARKGTFISRETVQADLSSMVGFFLHESYKHGISSPYYAKVFNHLQKHLTLKRLTLFYFTDIEQIDPSGVLAAIAASFPQNESELIRLSARLPIVLFDNNIKGHKIPAVVIDNFNATYRAIEYAMELGHKRIGFLSGPRNSSVGLKRLAGYQTALLDYSIQTDDTLICYGNYEFHSGYVSADKFCKLPNRPTFIHCANDLMAMGLIKGLVEKGIKIPDDISVSGFDDIDGCDRFLPSLTTMAVDYEKMAAAVVQSIMAFKKRRSVKPLTTIIPAELVVRDSTCELQPSK